MIKEETGHDFVWVIDYPIEVRPFYHMRHADNPKLTKSFDLMYRGVERLQLVLNVNIVLKFWNNRL